MRLAFLGPLPPAATGIADYSADVLGLLAPRHEIETFHEQPEVDDGRLPAGVRISRAATFLERHHARPYDLAVYQMGNDPAHAFLYPLLARAPGLLVLHDLVLHHSRAAAFLDTPEARAYAKDPSSAALRAAALAPIGAYRAEVAYSYPDAADRLVETQLGTVGDLLPYAYPLFRLPVEASRLTAVHNAFMADAIEAELPAARVVRVPMAAVPTAVQAGEAAALRARYGIEASAFVVGCFGLLTREKRIETAARAVARAAATLPGIRMLLVGPVPDRAALDGLLERAGIRGRAVVTGRVPFAELAAHMEATDSAVHLRYPTARETSAALLRLLAQGRPTVVSDLEHLDEIPDDAVVRTNVADEEGEVFRALLRLAAEPERRRRLGLAARAFVLREHSAARCLEGYEAALTEAEGRPDPPAGDWPPHWSR